MVYDHVYSMLLYPGLEPRYSHRYPHSCTYTSIHLMLLTTCSTLGTYGIGYTLNKLTLGFLFFMGTKLVISVYYFFKLVYI